VRTRPGEAVGGGGYEEISEEEAPAPNHPTGCGGNPVPNQNIFGVIASDNKLDSFQEALSLANVAGLLQGDGPFTIFAPTDSAFDNIQDPAILDRLLREDFRYHLTDLMLHHIISHEEICIDDLMNHRWLRMSNLERARIRSTRRGDVALRASPDDYDWSETNQLSVVFEDNPASNGVIHIINRVFLTRWIFQDLFQALEYHGYTFFASLLVPSGLDDILRYDDKVYTVLVPTEAAFFSLPDDVFACLSSDIALVEEVARYHILEGVHPSCSLQDGENVLTSIYLDEKVTLTVHPGARVIVNEGAASVVSADMLAYNGVIHEINRVLVPSNFPCIVAEVDPVPTPGPGTASPTLVDNILPVQGCDHLQRPAELLSQVVELDKRLDTLQLVLEATDLFDILNYHGVYTLFAPTDAAFMNVDPARPGILDRLLLNDFIYHLKDLLLYHVVEEEEICIDEMFHGQLLDLANGDQAKVKINSKGVFLKPFPEDYLFSVTNQLAVVFEDQSAANGVVHLINRVFVTRWVYESLFSILDDSEHFSILKRLLVTAELDETLSEDENTLTLLAPTDTAFLDLAQETIMCLGSNIAQLRSLLAYHTLTQVLPSAAIDYDFDAPTVHGTDVQIKVDATTGKITFNDLSSVVVPDLFVFNGVVHGIDRVLTLDSADCLLVG
jgi:transforming growth factor-beta-induced protein